MFVRKVSIYAESIAALNEQLKQRGRPPVEITAAPDVLEDDDILEMVNAGLAPITIVDDYLAEFWSEVFTDLKVHRDVPVRSGGAWRSRFARRIPSCATKVNDWLGKHGKGDGVPQRRRTPLSRRMSSTRRTPAPRRSAGSYRR